MAGTIYIKKGDDHILQFAFVDDDGVAVDITGKTVYFQIKRGVKDKDSDAIYENDWDTHSNPTGGITTLTLTNAITNAFISDEYLWQSRLENADTTLNSTDIGPCIILENLIGQ